LSAPRGPATNFRRGEVVGELGGSGSGGGRRSGRGGGGGTRGAGRRREKGRERVRVGADRPRLFGLELQDFVVILGNRRVFLQNFQQGRGSERCATRMP
jgi:hypothetical protein